MNKAFFYSLLALALCALLFCTGFMFLPEKTLPAPSFEEEKASLEEALAQARCAAEEGAESQWETVYFYEGALIFSLSPYASPFASEGLSERAACLASGEDCAELDTILRERDREGLADYRKACRKEKGTLTPHEIEKLWEEDLLLFSLPEASSPARRALIYDLRLLQESLEKKTDLYHGTKKALTPQEIKALQSLSDTRLKQLQGEKVPLSVNTDTLYGGERLGALLISLLTLLCIGTAKKNGARSLKKRSALFFTALLLLSVLTLYIAALSFAPATAQEGHLFLCGFYFALPGLLGILVRMLLRTIADLPAAYLCLSLREKERGCKKALAFLPLARYLLLALRPFCRGTLYSFLALLEPAELFFPPLYAHSPKNPPALFSLSIFALLFAGILFIKNKKRS